jgi:hypothetical protein
MAVFIGYGCAKEGMSRFAGQDMHLGDGRTIGIENCALQACGLSGGKARGGYEKDREK